MGLQASLSYRMRWLESVMPKKSYALIPGGSKDLCIQWRWGWRPTEVFHKDGLVLRFLNKKELKVGKKATLPDIGVLKVRLEGGLMQADNLRLEIDGEPLPGTAGDAFMRLSYAYGSLSIVAGLSLILGLLAMFNVFEWPRQFLGNGIATVIEGMVFAVLAYLTSRRSKLALGLGLVLFVGGCILAIVVQVTADQRSPGLVGGLIMRIFLAYYMFGGFKAIDELNERERNAVVPEEIF